MSYISIEPFDGWYESTFEDFCDNVAPSFGLSVNPKDVQFSGFWSQGDGASFTGNFYLSDVSIDKLKASVPTEVELHELAAELQALAEAHPEIQGKVTRMSSLYSHSNTMNIGDWSSNNNYCDEYTEAFEAADAETTLIRIFRELADWLYSRLEDEYEFYLADETTRQWADAIEERTTLQEELEQLQADIAENPPKTSIQSNALTSQVAALEVEIEILISKIEQLADKFHYWHEGESLTVEKFHEDHF